ncbi:Hvo_1808 family surface protein [Halostella sp. PRR32]|uniref:Hvo_1808 family surface protein n=1 Tax=Halostella sp. PRR32 TaxID=3098147 RepID=UPI002B1E22BF|nr:Hvo_1808 family surface protein [Halostella sp. PRR32]
MRPSRPSLLLVLLLVALAGCAAPTGFSPADTDDPTDQSNESRTDVQGWENGHWYNASLSVDSDNGLNDSELDAVVARSMARVERIRGVEFREDVDVTVVRRDEYRNETPGETAAGGDRVYENVHHRALFLVGDDADSASVAQQNSESSVLGYYSIPEDRIVIVSDSEQPSIDEITLSQELYHAYQFRYGNGVEIRAPPSASDDRVTALLSLIEGDANLVDGEYEARCEAEWDCFRPRATGGTGGDADVAAPDIHMGLYILSYFPYAEGQSYVESVRSREGWEGVSDQYDDPPVSTEQIIHGPDVAGPLPLDSRDHSTDDWERVRRSDGSGTVTVGEAGLATMFAYTLYDDREGSVIDSEAFVRERGGGAALDYDLNYSNGWGNDRLYAYENGDDAGYVWQIRWDDADNASTFVDGYERLLSYHGAERRAGHWVLDDGPFADAYYVERNGDTVTIASAPSADGLVTLHPPATGDIPADVRGDGAAGNRKPASRLPSV